MIRLTRPSGPDVLAESRPQMKQRIYRLLSRVLALRPGT